MAVKVSEEDFARSFGVSENEMSGGVLKLIKDYDFSFKELSQVNFEATVLKILRLIENDNQVIASKERKGVWQRGWQENLDNYVKSGYDTSHLIPKFIRPGNPIRWQRRYVMPTDPWFELNYIQVLRQHVFEFYFSDCDALYEFACGTGHNLVAASKLLPNLSLVGTDFVQPSVDILKHLATKLSLELRGYLFDMKTPNFNFDLKDNSGVLTFGGLEQLGGDIGPMLNYLVQKKPKICVHIEPMIELYNDEHLPDYLAIKFQSKRGYSSGLIEKVQELEEKKKANIIKVKRLEFGSLMLEGYNLLVWEPI